jgi:hypothetical protein
LIFLGCGSADVAQIVAPSIRNVQPQTVVAGTPSVTLSVEGSNFTAKTVVLWNGAKLATSAIDANTLSAAVMGGSIASPGTGQLQVQDIQTGVASPSVLVAIVSPAASTPSPLAISTTTLPAGIVGAAYSTVLAATGGTTAYSWSVSSGSLPAGLSLSAATGTISGTPTASGTFSFTVTVSDSSTPVQTASVNTSITITAAATSTFANVSVGTTPGIKIPSNFMGLSMEWGNAQSILGDSTVGVDRIARQLLLNLTAYGSSPLNLRIGGNTTDTSGEPTSTTVQPFAELATARGNHFSLGVNLGSENVGLAVDQAKAFVSQMPTGSIEAIEIGNEPDMYLADGVRPPPYKLPEYMADFNEWKTSIMPLLPKGTKLMGPSWASPSSLANAPAFDSAEASSLKYFSHHYYVADGLGTNPEDILLTPSAATAGAKVVAAAVTEAHGFGIPFRMGEMNSLFDGGEVGISNAFGSALWIPDAMFQYASVGVDGVNIHMGAYAIYEAFHIKVQTSGATASYSLTNVNPIYYGMLFFQAMTGKGGQLLPTTLTTAANLTTWGTIDSTGTPRLAIINKDLSLTGTVDVSISGYTHAQVYRLSAPSYQSTSGVSFAGQTFDGSTDGTIQGTQTVESITVTDGVFEIPMPITSAAVVVFSK